MNPGGRKFRNAPDHRAQGRHPQRRLGHQKCPMPEGPFKRVLVVEDDQDLLSLVSEVLEGRGYEVRLATNGREALTAISQRMPDLILRDMKMPVMDGWESARHLKARYDAPPPMVVLTAATDARQRAESIGAAGWVGKPFDVDVLVRAVDAQLRHRAR